MFKPVLRVLERLSSWILHVLGHGVAAHVPISEDELKLILADSHKGGVVSDGEADIIARAFEFADRQAEAVMIPAAQVDYLSLARPVEHNLSAAEQHLHARLPLCQDGPDTVVGTVSIKDAWPLLEHERSNAAFEQVCRPSVFVPVDFSQENILQALRRARAHIGIVRDHTNVAHAGHRDAGRCSGVATR
jgi:CBS domain containing-hemolysin-like protein